MLRCFVGKKFAGIISLLLLCCCCQITATAQYFSLDSNKRRVVIPFQMVRNLVVIKLKINSRGPFNFILDTGVGEMLITQPSLIDSINVISKRTIKISGVGEGNGYEAYITKPLNIDIDGIKSHNVRAAILKTDLFGLSNYAGMPIHGLLGYEFFNRLIVKINFADSLITAYHPHVLKGFKHGTMLPMSIELNRPYINTTVMCADGFKTNAKFIVDLGAGHALSLDNVFSRDDFSQQFIAGNLGVGLNGPIAGYLGRVKAVDIGKYTLKNLVASFPKENIALFFTVPRDGNIGVDVLKKFTLIFDYQGGALYFKPATGFNAPFEHDMSGLEYFATGDNYSHIIIQRVEPGSAGDLAGLEQGDEITAINFKPVDKMTLEQIDNIFRSRDNRVVLISVCHNKVYDTIFIRLKRRI